MVYNTLSRLQLIVLFAFVCLGISLNTAPAYAASVDDIAFTKIPLDVPPNMYTTLIVSPDHRLYASTIAGLIYHWEILPDGQLTDERVIDGLAGKIVVGMTFDPASTPEQPILWVTENWLGFEGAPNFSSGVNKITVSDYGGETESWTITPYIVGLPRSVHDHMANSLAFGPDGALYLLVGSASGMGAPDDVWDNRPEALLNASLLRIDVAALDARGRLPLDVKTAVTDENGEFIDGQNYGLGAPELADLYDPQAPDASVTIYATGMRNAYDLIWHSSGALYVVVNGGSAGGNAPDMPDTLPDSCNYRIDADRFGAFTGPITPGAENISDQSDLLLRIQPGHFYGHPNPTRCEWVLNGGNPTDALDLGQFGDHYPVGTQPDRNWTPFIYELGHNRSADGMIEYQSDTFDGALKGKLLITYYSVGKFVVILEPDATGERIVSYQEGVPGLTDFKNPLDLTEDVTNGNLYISEFGTESITLLRPSESGSALLASMGPLLRIGGALGVAALSVLLMIGTASGMTYLMYSRRHTIRRLWVYGAGLTLTLVMVVALYHTGHTAWRAAKYNARWMVNAQIFTMTPEGRAITERTLATPEPIQQEMSTVEESRVLAGQQAYQTTCVACHGTDAKGMPHVGVDLVNSEFVRSTNDVDLVAFIVAGRSVNDPANRSGVAMPPRGGNANLTAQQLEDIVHYLRVLDATDSE